MILVILMLFTLSSSSGSPAPSYAETPSSLFGRQIPECVDPTRYRTTQDILWSYLATIFACAWVAAHPNIPGPYDSRFFRFKGRVMLMIYALIAPEIMLAWAITQWLAAGRIAKDFNQKYGLKQTYDHTITKAPWYSLRPLDNWLNESIKHPPKRWTRTHGFFVQMGGFLLFKDEEPQRVLIFKDLRTMIELGEIDVPTIRNQ